MPDAIDWFLVRVEGYFGPYKSDEIKKDVRELLSWRIAPTKVALEAAYSALKLKQPVRFGPPDSATVLQAIEAWEEEKEVSLRKRKKAREFTSGEAVTPEEAALPSDEDLAEVRRRVQEQAHAGNPVAEYLLRIIDYREKEKA
jgi:hypothetical protein